MLALARYREREEGTFFSQWDIYRSHPLRQPCLDCLPLGRKSLWVGKCHRRFYCDQSFKLSLDLVDFGIRNKLFYFQWSKISVRPSNTRILISPFSPYLFPSEYHDIHFHLFFPSLSLSLSILFFVRTSSRHHAERAISGTAFAKYIPTKTSFLFKNNVSCTVHTSPFLLLRFLPYLAPLLCTCKFA